MCVCDIDIVLSLSLPSLPSFLDSYVGDYLTSTVRYIYIYIYVEKMCPLLALLFNRNKWMRLRVVRTICVVDVEVELM